MHKTALLRAHHHQAMTAHLGGLSVADRATRTPSTTPTVSISDIGDEEAANWDAEMVRRGYRP